MYVHCRYLARATLIPFLHDLSFDLDAVEEINTMKPKLFGALHSCLKMGHKLEVLPPSHLHPIKDFIMEATANTIDERLAVGYARLLWLTIQVYTGISL